MSTQEQVEQAPEQDAYANGSYFERLHLCPYCKNVITRELLVIGPTQPVSEQDALGLGLVRPAAPASETEEKAE